MPFRRASDGGIHPEGQRVAGRHRNLIRSARGAAIYVDGVMIGKVILKLGMAELISAACRRICP